MKKLFALLAVVLTVVSCQKDADLDVNVGGEQLVNITVALPEATRASSGAGFDLATLGSDFELRYILEIYVEGNTEDCIRKEAYTTATSDVVFPVRLVPGRDYRIVAWADIVPTITGERTAEGDYDYYYETSKGLDEVTIVENNEITWNAMDEYRDAYTAYDVVYDFSANRSLNLTLTRPFAKVRVVSTDIKDIEDLGYVLKNGTVEYSVHLNRQFNALNGTASDAASKAHTFLYPTPYTGDYENETQRTLFADYIFVDKTWEQDAIQFTMSVYENGGLLKTTTFNTDIALHANTLTTIIGEVLTEGGYVKVEVNGQLDEIERYTVVSSASQLLKVLNSGEEYILGNHIVVTTADLNEFKSIITRANETKTTIINLNGYTVTIQNDGTGEPVVLESGNTLIFAGEGAIEGTGALVDNSNENANVVVTGGATVADGTTTEEVLTGVKALEYIFKNGGEFTLTKDIDATEELLVSTTNPVVVNGNGFDITSNATRVVRITNSNAKVTFNNVNFVSSAVRVGTNDIRGISIDAQLSNVELALNNCSVDFTDASACDWAYPVNVSGNGTAHKVTVNGGTYEGANVINIHGANNTVSVKNATLNCLYPFNDLYAGACIWVLQNQGSSVYAEGNTFNGDNAWAFNLGKGNELVEKNNIDNTKYVAVKVGSTYYYNIAEAIAAAESDATIKVLQSHDCNVAAKVATGKTLTLDLNGKTITGTDKSTGSYALITNQGNLTITGNGTMTLVAENDRDWNAYSSVVSNTVGGKLVVENGTIEHLGGTDMAYGIDNLTNGKGTYAETVINGGNIKSTYRAIRMFLNGIEADNILTVNGGTIEGANKSIWMQDPSANANTGTLVVEADAELKGDAYLSVTAGSTEWPVEVSIADAAFEGESTLLSNNVPTGYEVVKKDGVWTVIGYTEVSTADELVAALEANESVKFMNDIKINPASMSNAYGTTGINIKNGQTIDGNGYTLNIKGAGGTWDSGINTTGGLIKNLTVTGSFRGIFINHTSTYSEKVILENVTIGGNGTVYTISCDQGLYQGIEATNCTFNGWTSFAEDAGEAKFVKCSFGEGSGYKYCRPYSDTEFVECTFCPGYGVDTTRATVTFTDCTFEE